METGAKYSPKQNPKAESDAPELKDKIKKLEKLIEELKTDNRNLRNTVTSKPLTIDFKKIFEIAGPICSMSFDVPTINKIEKVYYSGD